MFSYFLSCVFMCSMHTDLSHPLSSSFLISSKAGRVIYRQSVNLRQTRPNEQGRVNEQLTFFYLKLGMSLDWFTSLFQIVFGSALQLPCPQLLLILATHI